ncbi:hypothetical protein JKP88DRAFT_313067 [Tribonema minus]|uniref:BRCT domain-containing protein n=1 Tax=Tribonema minus TaxID=303371 RepID=A0A835Z0S7_9STRA|nr:hypothetical protein JKP88DRAFT_313067 [Tribonema minus]
MRSLMMLTAAFCGVAALKCGPNNEGVTDGGDKPKVCCPAECVQCGLECKTRFPGSEDSCCVRSILKAGKKCGSPPCVLEEGSPVDTTPGCDVDGKGLLSTDKRACCPDKCGTCGGKGCADRYTGSADDCCTVNVARRQRDCAAAAAPCATTVVPPTRCGKNGTGVAGAKGIACCPETCGVCGGDANCAHRFPDSAYFCCSSEVISHRRSCDEFNAPDAAAEAAAEAAAAAAAAAQAEEEAVAAEKAADEACADDGPLRGCVVCTTGLEPSLRERVRRAVESLGGEYSPGLTHATTHLLARAAAGDKYAIAAARPAAIAIATPDWALRCAAARARLPAADFALPPFAGVHACCSGLPAARRAAVAAAVAGGGGAYRGDMDVDVVTHLVTDAPRGAKFDAARRARGCCVVSPAWVDACVAAGARVPEAQYAIPPPPEEGEAAAAAAAAAEGEAAAAAGGAAAGGSSDVAGSPQGDDAFAAQLARARESGALSGCRVLLAGFAAPRAAALAAALRRARATRHAQPHPLLTHVVLGDPALVDAHTLEALASHRRAPRVVTAQWVFDSAAAAAALPAERYLAPPIARRDSSRQDARTRSGAAPAPAPLTDLGIAESAFAPTRPRAQPLFTSNSQPPASAGGAAAARKRRRTTGSGGGAVTFGGTRVEDGAFAPFSADCSSASAATRGSSGGSGDAGGALDQLLSGIGFVLPRGGFADKAEAAAVRARLEAHGGAIVGDAGAAAAAATDADDDADDIRDAPQLCYVMCARGRAPPDGPDAAAAAGAGTLACGGAVTPLWLEACVRKRRVYRADAWPLFSPTGCIAAAAAAAPAAAAAAAAQGASATAAAAGAVAPLQHFARGRGFAVCFTQVEGAERAGLEAAAALAGADVLEVLNRHVTHLVCGAPRGAKWEAAARYDAHIVSRGWLLHCLEHGYAHSCEVRFALAPGAEAAAAAAAAGGAGSSEQEALACAPATGAATAADDGCDAATSAAAAAAADGAAAAFEADAPAEDSLPPVPPSPDREPPSEPSQFTQVGLASLEAALLEARGGGGGGDGRRRTRMRRNLTAAAVAAPLPEAPPPSAATGGAAGGGGGSSGSGTSQGEGLLKISLAELERGGLASGKRLRSRGSFGASPGLYRGGESMAVESQVVEYEE